MHFNLGNWKQWKWKLEMENGNGNWKWKIETENGNSQNLMQMNARVKPLINNHLLKTTSVQRPPPYKDHIAIRFQRWLRYT